MKGFISLCGLAPGGEEYDDVESNIWLLIAGESPPKIVSGIAPAGGACNNEGSMVSATLRIVGDGNGIGGDSDSANVCGIVVVDPESSSVGSMFTSRIVVEGNGIGG